jgi:hypothetical protein
VWGGGEIKITAKASCKKRIVNCYTGCDYIALTFRATEWTPVTEVETNGDLDTERRSFSLPEQATFSARGGWNIFNLLLK